MIRFITFLVVTGGLVAYFYFTSRPRRRREVATPQVKFKRPQNGALLDDFWVQVYDTDSTEEVRKIQLRFHDTNIQCFLYEQGKKDVYGNAMKRYGISVPRQSSEKAQGILAQITL